MKKQFSFLLILLLSLISSCSNNQGLSSNNNSKNYKEIPSPAACYCVTMGYELITEKDSSGAERGYCILPNKEKVCDWAFYRGQVAKEYSYCARKGYKMVCDTVQKNSYWMHKPFCVKCDSLNNIIEKIDMIELMKLNGDTLINNCFR